MLEWRSREIRRDTEVKKKCGCSILGLFSSSVNGSEIGPSWSDSPLPEL